MKTSGVNQPVIIGTDSGSIAISARNAEHGSVNVYAHDGVHIGGGSTHLATENCPATGVGATKPDPALSTCMLYNDVSCCAAADDTAVADHLTSVVNPVFQSSPQCLSFMSHYLCGSKCAPDVGAYMIMDTLHVCSSFCAEIFAACDPVDIYSQFANA